MSFRSNMLLAGACALCAGWLLWSLPSSREFIPARARELVEPVNLGPAKSANSIVNSGASPTNFSSEIASGVSIENFQDWVADFADATTSDREVLRATGIELAKARQAALMTLIETDPEAAVAVAVSWEVRQQLPPEFHQYLEQQINGRANFEVTISDDLENQRREVRRTASLNGETYDAYVYGQLSGQGTTPNLPINGIALGDVLALADGSVRTLSPAETRFAQATGAAGDPICAVTGEASNAFGEAQLVEAAGELKQVCQTDHVSQLGVMMAGDGGKWSKSGPGNVGDEPHALDSWSQGSKTVLFMRVNFPDDLAEPISEAAAYDLMNGVNDFIVANSYGSSSMVTTVTPLLRLPYTKAYYAQYGDGQLLADARTVAREAGLDTAAFDLDAVRFTSVPGFSYGGKAYVRGKGCWLQSSSVGVAAHEFGHNYGLWHANYWTSSQASGIGPGAHSEYGDIFDTMGSANAGDRHFSATHRNVIDWLGDSWVRAVSGDGTYRLHAFDIDGLTPGRFYGLKIYKDYDRDYWVELRHRFASNKHIQNGVLLRWDAWADSASGAHLLDTTPASPAGNSSKDDAPIVLGRTFGDTGAGIFITPVAMQGSGQGRSVDVVVKLGVFTGNQLPTVAVQASATQVNASQAIVLTATASDPDGDALAYEWDFGDLNFGPNSAVVTNSWSAADEYVVRCRVSDMKGGFASAQMVVRVGNPATFQITGRVTDESGDPVEGVRVHNGSTTSSTYRGGFTDSDGNFIITRLTAGSHTVSASLYGYNFAPLGAWSNPVAVGPNRAGIDFTATTFPVVGWQIVDGNLGEAGNNTGTLRLSRTGTTTGALTVKFKRTGTASFSTDYTMTPVPGGSSPYTVAIPPGESSVDVVVTPIQDTFSEGPEAVLLTLAADATYVVGWQAEARLELVDDENPGKPSIYVSSSADNRATETGGDTGAFTLNRTGNKTGAVTVFYALAGTATSGADYAPPSGSAVIPAGETSVTVTFAALDDALVEGDETVDVALTPDAAYTVSGGTASVTVQDDDPPLVKLSVTDDVAVEGGSATARVLVQRVGSLLAPLTVEYTTSGTAASGADYTALPGSITIPGGAASVAINLTALNDTSIEGDETVAVVLISHTNYNIGLPAVAVMVIQDNEIPTLTLTATDATATEGGSDNGLFTVSRGSVTNGPLTVLLASSGQAVPGADYIAIPDSFVIPAGVSTMLLDVFPADDSLKEADEKVTLTLVASSAYNLGTTGPVSVTIKDNDSAAGLAIGFEMPAYTTLESQTTVRLPVVLSGASASAVTVNYAVTGGTAASGADFTLAAGTLNFAANQILSAIIFSLSNDSVAELDETIVVTLSAPAGAGLDAVTSHTVTIIDDDASVVSVAATDASASEGGGTGTLRLSRTGSNTAAASVLLQITGSASSPSDFQSVPALVSIPAGSSFVDLTIVPVDDATDELDETVLVRLTAVTGGRVGSPSTATVTIADNDNVPALPEVSALLVDGQTTEGLSDAAVVNFVRNGATTGALVVGYTVSGSATAGVDVAALSGLATIPDGASEVSVMIQAIGDGQTETMESLILTVASNVGYAIGTTATVTVQVLDSPFMVWQLANFTPQQLTNEAITAPEADPDGDGVNNFTEYAFNRNPNATDVTASFTQALEPISGGERVLVVTHQRRIVRVDVAYVLAVAPALGQWTDNSIELEEVSVTPDADGVTETVRTRVLAPTQHFDRRFVRLKVMRP